MLKQLQAKLNKELVFYSLISTIILGLLVLPGYIQTFDMPWGPELPISNILSNTWLLSSFINSLSNIISPWLIQKIILFLIFFLSGLGAHKLAQLKSNTFAYFAGILYVFNPFVSTRLMAGQWLVLLGYALLPWAIKNIYSFFQAPTKKNALKVILWCSAICLTSIHTVGLLFLISCLLLLTIQKKNLKSVLFKLTLIIITLGIINSFWIIPAIKGTSTISQNVSSFQESEFKAFATAPTVLNSPTISAILLTGFWADSQNRYILPSALPIWWMGVVGIGILVLIGCVITIKRKNKFGIIIATTGVIALVLAIGVSSNLTGTLTRFLDSNMPFYSGYREPHKWLMLLCIAYAYLGSTGAYHIIKYLKNKNTFYLKIILILLPVLFVPTLAFGAVGQLKSVDYPIGWYQAKEYLEKDNKDLNIVAFPWHQYLPVSFTGRVVANPVKYFFKGNIFISGDPELVGVPVRDNNQVSKFIREDLLVYRDDYDMANQKLKEKNVDYVILLKESDWNRYKWLETSGMQKVLENESLILYAIN